MTQKMSVENEERAPRMGAVPAQPFKDKKFCRAYYNHMVRARALEERLIKMMRSGDGYFWIGGPGEEAFAVALGQQIDKGHGLEHDFLHLHYRSAGIVLTMGAPMIDFIRQMKSCSTDPYSGGRNFVSHVARKDWNIAPITSTIETQFVVAPGTAMAQLRQRRQGKKSGVTLVIGGDAGTAEGDFASSLVWASRPGNELPMLMIVANNGYGISTKADTQHGEKFVADRAKAFGIQNATTDGNNPEKIWSSLETAFEYVRSTGKPYLLEVFVSRLHGHSSSSGALRNPDELCCIETFEKKLLKNSWLTEEEVKQIYQEAQEEAALAYQQVKSESWPDPSTIHHNTFAGEDTGGIPGRDF
jgi:2-oxoisovalerate dehydrogenase E1 component alpha subunit